MSCRAIARSTCIVRLVSGRPLRRACCMRTASMTSATIRPATRNGQHRVGPQSASRLRREPRERDGKRVRIAYLANARIPSRTANSMQVMKMCAALSAAGNDLTLIVPRFVRLLPTRSVLSDHYGVDLDFEIQWLRGWRTQGRMMVEARAVLRALGLRADLNFTRNVLIAAALAGARRPT